MSPRWVPIASCLSRRFSISTGGSDQSSFQTTASALGLRVCEILYVSFKSEIYFPQPSGSPQSKPCWPSKLNVLGACLPGTGPPGWGPWCGAQTPSSLGRTSTVGIILPFMGHHPGGLGLDYTASPPLLPVSLWFLLYIFGCRRSFLLVFGSFSLVLALYIVVIWCAGGRTWE